MKKILNISASLKIGGAEKVARDIGLYGDPAKFEHHYVVFGDDVGSYEQQIIGHGGKIFHLDEPSTSYIAYMRALRSLMEENSYYAVHAHTMFSCGWAMLVAKYMNVPVRISHAHSALDNGNRLVKRIYEAVMRWLVLHCSTDLVACGEKAGIRLFGKKAYKKRGKLILNGIDTSAFRFDPYARHAVRTMLGWDECLLIGHVGHLAEVKNQKFLLRLMPEIIKNRPEARLLILGEGDDRKMLEQTVSELGLSEYVLMPGNVSNVSDYLSAMDVYVFPSLYEGMPLSILEVQANGLPCILSTGVPKDVYLTDLITPLSLADDPNCWIDSILTAHRGESKKYADILKNAGFDLSGAMDKIYRIYRKGISND